MSIALLNPDTGLRLPPIPELPPLPSAAAPCSPFGCFFWMKNCVPCGGPSPAGQPGTPPVGGAGTGTGSGQIPLLNLGSLGSVSLNRDTVISAIVVIVGLILIVIGAASYVGKHRVI